MADEAVDGRIGEIRRQEAADISALLGQVVADGWQILDRESTESTGVETYKPAAYSDLCILMPARTALPSLEWAMEARNIPYRLESASLIFETQEIRDLLNCLKAIDDPADQVATVAALRSVAFGCSDVELFLHHRAGGRFNCLAEPSGNPDGPVAESLDALRRYHQARLWKSPAALIDQFVRERGLMETAAGQPRMREQWRRYRFMVERAWQFSAAGGGSLRSFPGLGGRPDSRRRAGRRVADAGIGRGFGAGDDHSRAKGLEFPVVILTGINSARNRSGGSVLFDRRNGAVEVGIGRQSNRFSTPGYEELDARERLMSEAEEVRLMYVAATRARDHLVISGRRSASRGAKSAAAAISDYLADFPHLWQPVTLIPQLTDAGPGEDGVDRQPAIAPEHTVAAWNEWEREREGLLADRGRASLSAATALRQHETEDKPEQETPEPWRRGRAGTSVGRAVHAALQSIDLDTGDGLEERARAQAAAEGVPDPGG